MSAMRYVLNTRSRILHKLPTREGCNVDQVPPKFRKRLRDYLGIAHETPNIRACRRCFPVTTPTGITAIEDGVE